VKYCLGRGLTSPTRVKSAVATEDVRCREQAAVSRRERLCEAKRGSISELDIQSISYSWTEPTYKPGESAPRLPKVYLTKPCTPTYETPECYYCYNYYVLLFVYFFLIEGEL
jgi:hypothetical protein